MSKILSGFFVQSNKERLAEHDHIMESLRADRLRTPPRPIVPARLAPSPQQQAPAATRRLVGYRTGEPHLVCKVCLEPAHVNASWLCERCQGEVSWRVRLAQQGLRVVS